MNFPEPAGDLNPSADGDGGRLDSASQWVAAGQEAVFAAFTNAAAMLAWLPPEGMIGHFERFDPSQGYRLVLTYDQPPDGGGKASDDSDVAVVRRIVLGPDRIVEVVEFPSLNPEQAERCPAEVMGLEWTFTQQDGGTTVRVAASDVPASISPRDHVAGLASSLAQLARYVESSQITLATPAQAEVVATLLAEFNREFDTPSPTASEFTRRFSALLGRPDVIVLLSGSAAAWSGFALLTLRPTPYYDGPMAQLEELYVRPSWRGRGIGTRLIDTAVQRVSERGAHEMQINVDEIDTAARRFYERHGFTNRVPGTQVRMLCYERALSEIAPDAHHRP